MPHMTSSPAEELLDQETKVLDKGFIRLIDYMGGDQRIIDAARVSYQGGTKAVSTTAQLIRYLLRHRHTTPFEKVRFEFHVKLPIFVARQWMRHRMGSFNEMSARYSILEDEFYFPDEYRAQSQINRQGSGEVLERSQLISSYTRTQCKGAYDTYELLLSEGVAREQARMVLPVNIYTQFYWTVDLWNLMHFLGLRCDNHTQLETREYAVTIRDMARAVCPIAMEAWDDYIFGATNFSRVETEVLLGFVRSKARASGQDLINYFSVVCQDNGMLTTTPSGKRTREFQEFLDKLNLNVTE